MSKKFFLVCALVACAGYLLAQAPAAPVTPAAPATPAPVAPEAVPAFPAMPPMTPEGAMPPAMPPMTPEGALPPAGTPEGEIPALPEIPDEELFIGKVAKEGDNFFFQEEEGSRWELEKNDFVTQIEKTAMGKPLEVFGKVNEKDGKKYIEITSFEVIEEEDALFAPEGKEGEVKAEEPKAEEPKAEAPKTEAPKAEVPPTGGK